MLQLRKILLCNYLYYSIFLITIFFLIIRLSIPKESIYNENSKSFTGIITKIEEKENSLKLYIKNKETIIASLKENIPIQLGDKVKITGTFQEPSKATTSYLFDYKEYCKRNNIYYLVNVDKIKMIKKNRNIYYIVKNIIKKNLNNNPYLNTFLLGDKSYLTEEAKRSYQENGISHLFAISGMHIALLGNIIEKLLKKLKKQEEDIFHITSIILIIYLLLVGFSPSILRGVLFYIGFSINRIYYFYINPKNLFLLLLSISLWINPFYIYDVGFQFSYWISFSLIIKSNLLQSNNYLISLLKVSILSFLVSIPISIYHFHQINILSILYNLFFVPLVSLIVFPLSLIVMIVKPLLPIYNIITSFMENISIMISTISIGKILFKRVSIFIYIIDFFLLLLFLLRDKKEYLYLFCIVILIHFTLPYLDQSTYVEVLDVGQGDSILIHNKNNNLLIDTGGLKKEGLIYYHTLEPVFRSKGIKKLKALIISHGDKDHLGEAINLVNNIKVEKVIFNCGKYNDLEQELIKVLDKKMIKYYSCIKELTIDNNKLYFLQTKEYDNENDNSNVVYIDLNGYKFLFMGDASTTTEKEIISIYNLPNIDVFKVGHHGSKTSSSKNFINEINPQYSIISVGKNNRYGHPNKEVLNNLKESKIYRTDVDGSIMFKIKNNKLKIETCSP